MFIANNFSHSTYTIKNERFVPNRIDRIFDYARLLTSIDEVNANKRARNLFFRRVQLARPQNIDAKLKDGNGIVNFVDSRRDEMRLRHFRVFSRRFCVARRGGGCFRRCNRRFARLNAHFETTRKNIDVEKKAHQNRKLATLTSCRSSRRRHRLQAFAPFDAAEIDRRFARARERANSSAAHTPSRIRRGFERTRANPRTSRLRPIARVRSVGVVCSDGGETRASYARPRRRCRRARRPRLRSKNSRSTNIASRRRRRARADRRSTAFRIASRAAAV